MPNIGPMEIAIVLGIMLLIFGPKKLPELGRSAGKSLKEFQNGLRAHHDAEPESEETRLIESEKVTQTPQQG